MNSYLEHPASISKIAGTIHKNPLTAEIIQKLFESGELASVDTKIPRALMQTTWFYVSLYFGKRGRENQSLMKKSMLRLAVIAAGEEYFELNKEEPGAVLSTKNHTDGLEGTEDHADGKIFSIPGSKRCAPSSDHQVVSFDTSQSGGRVFIPTAQGTIFNSPAV